MSQLLLPDRETGINAGLSQEWWAGSETSDLLVEAIEGATLLESGAFPWPERRTLLVVGPIRTWLAGGSLADRTTALHRWRDCVRTLAAADAPGTVHLSGHASEPRGLDELLALAAGRRWPDPDLDLAAPRPGEPAWSGDHEEPEPVVREFRALLGGLLQQDQGSSRLTQSLGFADAVAALRNGVDADPALSAAEADELRQACRAVLRDIADDGVHVGGRRDLLLWPVPARAGRVPLDVAAEVAAEVLRGQVERPTEWPAELVRIGELERQVAAVRAEIDLADAAEPSLATIGGRALLRRLVKRAQ